MDFSPIAIDFCRRQGLEDVEQGDATNLSYEDGRFDGVLAFDVLEHLADDGRRSGDHRVLPAGRPRDRDRAGVPCALVASRRGASALQAISLRDWPPLAERTGFAIDGWSYFFSTVFPLVAVLRFVSRALAVKKTLGPRDRARALQHALEGGGDNGSRGPEGAPAARSGRRWRWCCARETDSSLGLHEGYQAARCSRSKATLQAYRKP
jgi:hypothetical protein